MSGLVCIVLLLGSNVYTDTFERAVQAYEADDYGTAIQLYEQLVAEGVEDPAVFYNSGNAYYRNGDIGAAIANYERALQLAPRFENARENLDKAVRDTQQRLSKPLPSVWEQSLLFWHYGMKRSTTYRIAAVLWCLFWGVLALRQWRPLRYTRRAALLLAVLGGAFAASAWAKAHPVTLAVAHAESVPVRYGTHDDETLRFELRAGDRVTVDRRQGGWARVTTVDGERGWVHEDAMMFVGPPYLPPPSAVDVGEEAVE
ncbi:MAG: tetratricopeptide repeat protein [Nitrospiraceae bacterium]|nr:tetratricopeptide repeat protein [Nitrospiraceae bacterium]